MNEMIKLVKEEVSKRRLYQSVKEVSSYHRIQASNGYRDAANHCVNYLKSVGIDTQLLQYPTSKEAFVEGYKLFQEWKCDDATCELIYPFKETLADFRLEPISIIQKSYPCDYRKEPLDVVLMDKGHDEKAYDDIDFTKKIVFIHEHFSEYEWVLKRGAYGFISDFLNEVPFVRTRADMYDSLNYTSFWWKNTKEELPAFGFVLSPRKGDELTKVCKDLKERYQKGEVASPFPQVRAFVDATLFDGTIDVVEATLPGISKDTILLTAHLCHPCASANDNASGVAGGMEVLRSIKQLIDQKKLKPLEKTIKLILIPEFTGTYCYLCDGRDLSNYIAGINLDMIGGRQQDGYGPITLTNLPHACPSFVDDLANLIMRKVKEDVHSIDDMSLRLVHTQDESFTLGSDHFILSDPQVNIPCIMLGQWPDKHYHTSTDTLEKIDPNVLKFSTVTATAYTYSLCNFEDEYKVPLYNQMRLQYIKEMNRICESNRIDKDEAYRQLHEFYVGSLKNLENFCDVDNKIHDDFTMLLHMYVKGETIKKSERCGIPKRKFHTPFVDIMDIINGDKNQEATYKTYQKNHVSMGENHGLLQTLCDYYIDGVRDEESIAKAVIAEAGYGTYEDIYAYLNVMKELKLIL